MHRVAARGALMGLALRFLAILSGRNLPKIRQAREPERRSSMKRRSRTLPAWLSKRGFGTVRRPLRPSGRWKSNAHARPHPPPQFSNRAMGETQP
jgi:hypothetical protein